MLENFFILPAVRGTPVGWPASQQAGRRGLGIKGLTVAALLLLAGCGTPRPIPIYQPPYYSRQLLGDIDWRLRMQELDRGFDEIERLRLHRQLMDKLDELR